MTERKLKIGVLETGRPPEDMVGEFGDYPGMVESWLSIPVAEYKSFAVLDGIFPAAPEDAHLWVITGSKHGVYEDHPWISPLEDFIRACRAAATPMVGICFGHQMIAQALGGRVVKSDKGWGLGVHDYAITNWPEALGDAPEGLSLQAYHQDQIIELPEGAERIASSAFCDNAAVWYPGFALTVQGHPEFAAPYVSALLEARRGTVLSDADVDPAQDSMTRPTNQDELATIIKRAFAKSGASKKETCE